MNKKDVERLRHMDLGGWIIIEHHSDGQNIVGNLLRRPMRWVETDESFMICWRRWSCALEPSGVARFSPSSWKLEIADADCNVVFFKRIAKDSPEPENEIVNPCPEADLYTLVRASVGYF
ncbi:MAG: hypothetical protein WC348_04175 [Patescibacteria group bacterium]|jgi:hypothetical protein